MKLFLGGGHWDGGRFFQFVYEARDDGTWGTGFKMDCTAASNHAHAATLRMLTEAELTSVAAAAARYPLAFHSTRR